MTRVKICGIMTHDGARMVADAGADMLGFNFYKPSPRYIEPGTAREICDRLHGDLGSKCPILIGVFVNATGSEIISTINQVGLDFAQLSGDESVNVFAELRGKAFKAIRPMNKVMALDDVQYFQPHLPTDERAPSLLLDAYHPKLYGGTGEEASTEVAEAVKEQIPRLMLAGGLKPENITARVEAIRPWGVDVASGVEPEGKPGIKDAAKVKAFIEAVKSVTM